ncbi:MAG: hypothetical protein LBR80_11365 [Deltaproteobacteria bacterium]|jgi:hypothetical protein|nr:hypothetical protein [Deltaproteobacteria bacterium]
MKRFIVIFAFAVALAVMALSPPVALAESPVTFSGYLRLRTFALGGFFPQNPELDKISERYAISRLRVNVSFKPTDNVEVRWRFHGPHGSRFGSTNVRADSNLFSVYYFGIIKTELGTFRVGRVSSDIDSAGLQTLGYYPMWGFESQGLIFDRDSENDGIMYMKEWENGFGLKAFYIKRAHMTPTARDGEIHQDADYDRVSFEPFYKWDTGGASFALQYDRNNFNFTNGAGIGAFNPNVKENYLVSLNPAFFQTWAMGGDKSLTMHAEAKYSFGRRQPGPIAGVEQDSIDQDGFGAYLDFTLGYPQGDVALAGWYFAGNDDGGAGFVRGSGWKDRSMVNPGEGFYPFLIFYYASENYLSGGAYSLEGYQSPGHWALAVLGNHKLNDFVTLNYSLGTFRKTADYYLTPDVTPNRKASRSLGSEVNVGVTVNIMDHLQWQSKLALFDAGDYYSDRYGRSEFDRTLWGWANQFLFSF